MIHQCALEKIICVHINTFYTKICPFMPILFWGFLFKNKLKMCFKKDTAQTQTPVYLDTSIFSLKMSPPSGGRTKATMK